MRVIYLCEASPQLAEIPAHLVDTLLDTRCYVFEAADVKQLESLQEELRQHFDENRDAIVLCAPVPAHQEAVMLCDFIRILPFGSTPYYYEDYPNEFEVAVRQVVARSDAESVDPAVPAMHIDDLHGSIEAYLHLYRTRHIYYGTSWVEACAIKRVCERPNISVAELSAYLTESFRTPAVSFFRGDRSETCADTNDGDDQHDEGFSVSLGSSADSVDSAQRLYEAFHFMEDLIYGLTDVYAQLPWLSITKKGTLDAGRLVFESLQDVNIHGELAREIASHLLFTEYSSGPLLPSLLVNDRQHTRYDASILKEQITRRLVSTSPNAMRAPLNPGTVYPNWNVGLLSGVVRFPYNLPIYEVRRLISTYDGHCFSRLSQHSYRVKRHEEFKSFSEMNKQHVGHFTDPIPAFIPRRDAHERDSIQQLFMDLEDPNANFVNMNARYVEIAYINSVEEYLELWADYKSGAIADIANREHEGIGLDVDVRKFILSIVLASEITEEPSGLTKRYFVDDDSYAEKIATLKLNMCEQHARIAASLPLHIVSPTNTTVPYETTRERQDEIIDLENDDNLYASLPRRRCLCARDVLLNRLKVLQYSELIGDA